ncbi:unnamed protein product [Phaeothamnion confervicola]
MREGIPNLLPSSLHFFISQVPQTNYPEMFVQNSKLQRQLLKCEKEIDRLEGSMEQRKGKVFRVLKFTKMAAYGILTALFWRRSLIEISPDALWLIARPLSSLSGGGAGAVGATGLVFLFQIGLAARFPS